MSTLFDDLPAAAGSGAGTGSVPAVLDVKQYRYRLRRLARAEAAYGSTGGISAVAVVKRWNTGLLPFDDDTNPEYDWTWAAYLDHVYGSPRGSYAGCAPAVNWWASWPSDVPNPGARCERPDWSRWYVANCENGQDDDE